MSIVTSNQNATIDRLQVTLQRRINAHYGLKQAASDRQLALYDPVTLVFAQLQNVACG
jgi:hypothetical protein